MKTCTKCGAPLSRDEIGLHRKIVDRCAEEYFCLSCMAAYFKVTEDDLRELIERYRDAGCLLFQ